METSNRYARGVDGIVRSLAGRMKTIDRNLMFRSGLLGLASLRLELQP